MDRHRQDRSRAPGRGPTTAGTVGAVVLFFLSVTPSLLPRPWLLQGVLGGLAAGLGYVVGVGAGRLARPAVRRVPERFRVVGRRVVAVLCGPLVVVIAWQGARWQAEVARLVGMAAPTPWSYLRVPVAAGVLLALLLAVARARRRPTRWLRRRLAGRLPARVAACAAAGTVLVAMVLVQLTVGYVVLAVADADFRTVDEVTDTADRPTAAERSGSPASLVSWESLGREGQAFVSAGPTAAQLSASGARPGREPIRAFVGRRSAASIHDAATVAVRELDRTGAFGRAVLCVVTTTGRGHVDLAYVRALEHMYGGDTAIVAIQYSYLPSWLSFLLDGQQVRLAGRELFDQVHARWSALPVAGRPKLVVFGESLGALGADSAFTDLTDLARRTDGALLVGPPDAGPNWRAYSDATVKPPGIVFLWHDSDPVVRWSPELILTRPDWLDRPGSDVAPAVRWYPLLTFAQVTADMLVANDAAVGHGHNYRGEAAAAWAAVVPPPGWTTERTDGLRLLLAAGDMPR